MNQNSENSICPKCGSSMIDRKIWNKFKAIAIVQCSVCKYYIIFEENPGEDI